MTTAHEPRRGPGAHLSVEDLSALAEGAQPSAAGAAEHLLGCDACRAEVDAMSELLAQFEEWDVPAMPQEVAIRIDAALARESAARAATSGHPAALARGREASTSSGAASVGTGAPETALPESTSVGSTSPGNTGPAAKSPRSATDSRRRRRLPARGLGWALASLILIAGGVSLALNLHTSGTQASSSTAAGSGAAQPYAATNGGQGMNGPQAQDSSPRALALRAASAQLSAWTKQALSNHRPEATLDSPCLSDPAFSGSHVVAIASGPYNGTPATLVVYANPSDASTVTAVVYATPCTAKNYRVLDQGVVTK